MAVGRASEEQRSNPAHLSRGGSSVDLQSLSRRRHCQQRSCEVAHHLYDGASLHPKRASMVPSEVFLLLWYVGQTVCRTDSVPLALVTRTLYPMQFRTDVTDFRVLFLCGPVMLGAPAAQHTHCNTPGLPFAALDGCIGLVGGVVGPGKVLYEIWSIILQCVQRRRPPLL